MRFRLTLSLGFILLKAADCKRDIAIVHTNDDGMGLLAYHVANAAMKEIKGAAVFGSAPADDSSYTSSLMYGAEWAAEEREVAPVPFYEEELPAGSPVNGYDPRHRSLTYVTGTAVEAAAMGLRVTGPEYFGRRTPIKLLVSGPNVGNNMFEKINFSSTTAGAAFAAFNRFLYPGRNYHLPAVAFSMFADIEHATGLPLKKMGWNYQGNIPKGLLVAGQATRDVVQALINGGGTGDEPLLPPSVWLNVNFPDIAESGCDDVSKYKYVLTRNRDKAASAGPDYDKCNSPTGNLPLEGDVRRQWALSKSGDRCYLAISVMDASTKYDWDWQTAVKEWASGKYVGGSEYNVEFGPALISMVNDASFMGGHDPLERWICQAPTQKTQKKVYKILKKNLPGGLHCLPAV